MTEAQAIELVAQRFITAWPGATSALLDPSGTPYGSPGVPYALPNEARRSADVFVQLTILPFDGRRIAQGAGVMYQQWRYITLVIYVPANTGTLLANQIAGAARTVFQGQTLTSGGEEVTLDVGMPRNVAATLDGRWYVSAVQFLLYWFE